MRTVPDRDLVHVETKGRVGSRSVHYLQEKVAAALRPADRPVLFARARLTRLADPALDRPWLAEVNVDLNGRLVRVQVARPTMLEAVDEAHDRLQARLVRSAGNWEAIRGTRSSGRPGEWRHGSLPADRAPHFPRPVDERRVVRHKAFAVPRSTVDEAAFDMDLLDYSFHLFTEAGSGVDSVLSLTSEEPGYLLTQVDPQPDRVTQGSTTVTISPQPAPVLDDAGAADRLALTGAPFVFFRDAASGRGCVLYVRYDGHYGLLVPAG